MKEQIAQGAAVALVLALGLLNGCPVREQPAPDALRDRRAVEPDPQRARAPGQAPEQAQKPPEPVIPEDAPAPLAAEAAPQFRLPDGWPESQIAPPPGSRRQLLIAAYQGGSGDEESVALEQPVSNPTPGGPTRFSAYSVGFQTELSVEQVQEHFEAALRRLGYLRLASNDRQNNPDNRMLGWLSADGLTEVGLRFARLQSGERPPYVGYQLVLKRYDKPVAGRDRYAPFD